RPAAPAVVRDHPADQVRLHHRHHPGSDPRPAGLSGGLHPHRWRAGPLQRGDHDVRLPGQLRGLRPGVRGRIVHVAVPADGGGHRVGAVPTEGPGMTTVTLPRPTRQSSLSPAPAGRERWLPAVFRHTGRWLLFAALLLIFVTPLWSIAAAALSGTTVAPGSFVIFPGEMTLRNIIDTWGSERIARYFLNSLVVVGLGVPLQTAVSAVAAYALARKRFRGGAIILLLIRATRMMPEAVVAIPLYLVLSDLPAFGVSLLNTYPGMILPLVGWACSILVLMKFRQEIPREMEEAARVGGAR